MIVQSAAPHRELRVENRDADLVVVGGGLAGTCCAITAARAGLKVLLVQDRPVLGGNASSEVRLWVLGATAHMAAPQRWAREGGVVNELLIENLWRNPEGNSLFFDTLLLDKVLAETNITLLLNTAVFEARKTGDAIASVRAICSQNSTLYDLRAPLFCDASGDGVLGFLSGAAFRMGAESKDEFGEKFAPDTGYGELLGHSMYFYSKDAGRPIKFVPPSFALDDITRIPRYRQFSTDMQGCQLWWIEYGGRLDTVHDTEKIKWELWSVVYGVWNHIKNSGQFPEAENLTLEWVSHIPGKRESRRFEGDTILRQQDIIEQRPFEDAVAFGGWAIDLHPADGIYSPRRGWTHWRMKGIYPIPYRCLYSRNVPNLFLGGRTMSCSHVAFGSTRVMGTLAHCGQAIALAAALCREHGLLPRDITQPAHRSELQLRLLRTGQHIPGVALRDAADLAAGACLEATSTLQLAELPPDGDWLPLNVSRAMLLPLQKGRLPRLTMQVEAEAATELRLALRTSAKPGNFVPEVCLGEKTVFLERGESEIVFDFEGELDAPCYGFFCLTANENVRVRTSTTRLSGVLALSHERTQNPGGADDNRDDGLPHDDIGVESFEIWISERRPGGRNLACRVEPPLRAFEASNVLNGLQRPTDAANCWLASESDLRPRLTLRWELPQRIARTELFFDCDWDHAMESVLRQHPERALPFCVRAFRLLDEAGRELYRCDDNYQARHTVIFEEPVQTAAMSIELQETWGQTPRGLFEVRCYEM